MKNLEILKEKFRVAFNAYDCTMNEEFNFLMKS